MAVASMNTRNTVSLCCRIPRERDFVVFSVIVTLILRDTLIGALENVIHAIQFPRFPRERETDVT